MTVLSQDRNTPMSLGDIRQGSAAAVLIFAGALVMRDANGDITKGQVATTLVGAGRAEERVDNSGGAAGDLTVKYRPGVFRFANSAAGDAITATEIGKPCYAVDDQTVAKTDGTATRSIAGFVEDVDNLGVWVRFDEALVRAYLG